MTVAWPSEVGPFFVMNARTRSLGLCRRQKPTPEDVAESVLPLDTLAINDSTEQPPDRCPETETKGPTERVG